MVLSDLEPLVILTSVTRPVAALTSTNMVVADAVDRHALARCRACAVGGEAAVHFDDVRLVVLRDRGVHQRCGLVARPLDVGEPGRVGRSVLCGDPQRRRSSTAGASAPAIGFSWGHYQGS
jgi:hypothetical protein